MPLNALSLFVTGQVAALIVAGIAGCASTAVTDSSAVWVQPTLRPAMAGAQPYAGTLIIKRDAGGGTGMQSCNHRISIDGAPFVDLKPGQGVKVFAPLGKHVVGLSFTSVLCNSGESAASIDVQSDRPTILRIVTSPDNKSQLLPSPS